MSEAPPVDTFYLPRVIRRLAAWTLALYGLCALLVALTFAFPQLGGGVGGLYIYIPPQLCAAGLAALLTMALALLTGAICLGVGVRQHRWAWALAFATLLAGAPLGPATSAMRLHDIHSIPLSEAQGLTLLCLSCAAFLLIPLLAVVFAALMGRPRATVAGRE